MNQAIDETRCKDIAWALIQYAADHDQVLPPELSDETVERVIDTYHTREIGLGTHNSNGSRFAFPSELAGKQVSSPYSAIVYETADWPGGGRIIALPSGTVYFVHGFDEDLDLPIVREQIVKSAARSR